MHTGIVSNQDWRDTARRAGLFPIIVVLHFVGATLISMVVGFIPEATLGQWIFSHVTHSLEPFSPFVAAIAAVLGFLVARSWHDRRAVWAWIPGLLWFALGIHSMLLVNGIVQSGQWVGSSPSRFLFDNLLSDKCGDTECLNELFFTTPLVCSVAYSLASGATLWKASKVSRA